MTALELRSYIDNGQVEEKPGLKIHDLDTHKYYHHQDGRVFMYLESCPNEIIVFESIEAFKKVKKIATGHTGAGSKHILAPYQFKLKYFDDQLIERQKLTLGHELNVNVNYLNYSSDSLKQIDKAIKYLKTSQEHFFKNIYFPLFLYSGEIIRRSLNGRWVIKKTDGFFEPIIVLPARKIFYFKTLYKDAFENFESFSVEDSATTDLSSF